MQDVQMAVRNAFREFMTQNLTTANMPTRDDIVRLGEAVLAIEKRLERIEGLLARFTQQPAGAPAAGPPRTRQPPPAGGAS
jgi:hypothetical protein